MKVPFVDLKAQYASIKDEVRPALDAVLESCAFAGGPFVAQFEEAFAKAHGAAFCVAMSSGTAALHAAMLALEIGPGDEVIVPANTFFATAEAVSLAGATPVFVDCEARYYNLDPERVADAITPRTRAIAPVHLYGQPAQLGAIVKIATDRGLALIEDAAQAHLATYDGAPIGTVGAMGCFSFYPGKNLGAYGEGGAVLTNDPALADVLRELRNPGSTVKYRHRIVGHNYRMSGFQGAVLDVKLKHLAGWTAARRRSAALYREHLAGIEGISLPAQMEGVEHSYHLYVVRSQDRDGLAAHLKERGIATGLHYPVPCHLQPAYASLGGAKGDHPVSERLAGEILSLPMFPELTEEQIAYVAEQIRAR